MIQTENDEKNINPSVFKYILFKTYQLEKGGNLENQKYQYYNLSNSIIKKNFQNFLQYL